VNYQPLAAMPTEFALAVECCRWSFSGDGEAAIRELAQQTDWTMVLAWARRHRIQGLVWNCLNGLDVSLPPAVGQALSEDARLVAEQGLRAASESAELLLTLTQAGAAPLFVKGLTLGKLAFGNPFLKMSLDIDLLVPAETVAIAAAELERRDYRLAIPPVPPRSPAFGRWHRARKESAWQRADGSIVDLHSRLADNDRLIPGIGPASPWQIVEILPGIRLPTLATEELFAYLCVHGASSAWFRLKWIADLAGLLHGRGAAEIEHLYRRSQALGAERAAAQALLLARRLFDTEMSRDLLDELDGRINRWLTSAALGQMTVIGEPTVRPLGTAMIHLTEFFLKPGLAFKASELRRQARDALGIY
jgi:hypothetical protein